jgi:hypothetical protein
MKTQHDRAQAHPEPTPEPTPGPASPRRAAAIDDALDRLSAYDYVDGPGMAVHGPMGAEALSALGHDDLIADWVEGYKARHQPIAAPPAATSLAADDESIWRPALGDLARLTDWAELFARQLEDRPWQDVVASWVPRLLSGYAGAFTHGLIRTAHAVRGLAAASPPSPLSPASPPSPLVIAELATALAYWAGSYKPLPGQPGLRGDRSLDEALAGLPRPAQVWTPMEAGQFTRIHELAGFPEAVEALGPPSSPDAGLSDLTVRFARAMLANPDVHPFGLVHAITPVAGARALLPYLPTVTAEQVYAQLWHVDAAIAAGFLPRPGGQDDPDVGEGEPPTPAELSARAAEHKDPHVVKFTEACIREHALRPDPAYLLAAQHVMEWAPPW